MRARCLAGIRNRTTAGTTRYDATYYYQDGSLWDHTGNPVKRTENIAGSTYTTTLRYDAVYRQTEETKRDSSNNVVYGLTYGYDAVGNRTSRTLGGTTTTYGYDDNSKLLTVNGVTSCTYDWNGNLTNSYGNLPSKDMTYNDDNRLTSITYGGTTDYYYYQYTGLRYRARLNGTYYRYLYDGERVLEELNDSGTMQARYTTEDETYEGMWLHLYRTSGTLSRFPMYDNIGTARGLLDASGTATDWYELDTFGRQVSSSGTTPNPYRYGGAWGYITDPSGLLQLGARFYWPELGRFVSQDPIADGDNWYDYGGGNPVVTADPTGEHWYDPFHWFHPRPKPKPKPSCTPKPCPKPPKPCPPPRPGWRDWLRGLWTGGTTATLPCDESAGTLAGSGATTAGNIIGYRREADWWYDSGSDADCDYPEGLAEQRRRWGRAAERW